MRKILMVIDMQNDFINGSLAVAGGREIIPHINSLIASGDFNDICFSQDWHTTDHTSFAKNHEVPDFTLVKDEMKWPVHCVEGTYGWKLHEDLVIPAEIVAMGTIHSFYAKGEEDNIEEYSAVTRYFVKDGLYADWFNHKTEVTVVGLATDYCVKATVIDLCNPKICGKMKVTVDLAGCRGVSEAGTVAAIAEMKAAGAKFVNMGWY